MLPFSPRPCGKMILNSRLRTGTSWARALGVSKGQGVVVLLSKLRFCRAHVRFQAEFPGRILHVRITVGCSSIDVVAVYQHVWALKAGEPLEALLHRRRRIWDRLQRLLARLPRRSRLIVGGGFNCSLLQHSPYVGPGAQPLLSNNSQDQEDFQNMIIQNDYCVLNTWMHKHSHTYEVNAAMSPGLRSTFWWSHDLRPGTAAEKATL